MKKIVNNSQTHKWEYENIGGSTRVKIVSGADIEHLAELDPKKWTVLSCPVVGLEIDEKSLAYIDTDGDAKIHLNDVTRTASWVTSLLKNSDLLLEGKDSIDIDEIDTATPVGQKLYGSAKQILSNLGKEGHVISIADISDSAAIFAKTRFNGDGIITEAAAEDETEKAAIAAAISTVGSKADRSGAPGIDAELIETFYKNLSEYAAWTDSAIELPFGDKTDAVIDAYNRLDAKIKDFFVRSRLAAFAPDSKEVLDVRASRIEAISSDDLSTKEAEIASYPVARITGTPEINLDEPVNPAWASAFDVIKSAMGEDKNTLNEADWNSLKDIFTPYLTWKAAKAGAVVEPLGIETVKTLLEQNKKDALLSLVEQDNALKEAADDIDLVDKFLHIFRDFYTFLKNFVTFQDFYNPNKKLKAVFQVGTLIIDQRACHFCMNVADAGKHGTMAPSSGMYLVYCDCVSKGKPGVLHIVAAVTVGDVGDLFVGKNAIFYDNKGLDYDAVVTKIIENPISISQAFWSPYRRVAKMVENLINKSAADKDAKMMAEANAKLAAAPAAAPGAPAAAKPPFDIAKFAGIFAAISIALGAIGTALAAVAKAVSALSWWQVILVIVGVMLLISGPSMVLAWMKLRRRNIAPLLNANGWAINASSNISIPFGATLTDNVKFPKLNLKDPYAKKGLAPWQRWCISLASLAVVVVALWLCNLLAWAALPSPLKVFNKQEANVEELNVEQVATEGETLTD